MSDPEQESSVKVDDSETTLTPSEILNQESEDALKYYKANDSTWPEDMDVAVGEVARQKKMTRDTQKAFTKNQQALSAEKARSAKLMKHAMEADIKIPAAQQEELNELKFTDPDAYILTMTRLKEESRQARENEINLDLSQTSKAEELEYRKTLLKQFKDTTGLDITEDVMINDVPPRITRKLEQGEISFEEFLAEAGRFLKSEKVIDKTSTSTTTKKRFSATGGSSSVTDKQEAADLLASYADGTLDI